MFGGIEVHNRLDNFVRNRLASTDQRRETVQRRIDDERVTIEVEVSVSTEQYLSI